MKKGKINGEYFLLTSRFNDELRQDNTDEDIFKFRISKDGGTISYRRNVKDLKIIKKRVEENFYNYDEFIGAVVDAILEDLKL